MFRIHHLIPVFVLAMALLNAPAALCSGRFQAGISGMADFPQGEFKDYVGTAGGGFGLEFVYRPSSPLGFGVSFGYLIYGNESRRETIRTSLADFDTDVTTTNSLIQGHLLFRAQGDADRRLRPYFDALVGVNAFRTDTRIEGSDWDSDDDLSTKNLSDEALSYGGGVGLLYRAYQSKPRPGEARTFSIHVDLRLRYIKGGEAQYLKKGSITRENGKLIYDILQSETDLITTQLGITFEF